MNKETHLIEIHKKKNQGLEDLVVYYLELLENKLNLLKKKIKELHNLKKIGKKFKGLAKFVYDNILNDPNYIKKYSKLKKEETLIEFSYWGAGFMVVFPIYFLIGLILFWIFLSFVLGFNLLIFLSILFTLIPLGIILGIAVAFVLLYIYPDWKLYKRKKSLDANTALATIYMELLYTAGMPPQYIFKILSKFPEFKEVYVEAKFINRLINLGIDLPNALDRAAKTCPDSLWKQLIEGMKEMIISGGDLRTYLNQKREEMIDAYRAKYKAYTDFLGILIEVYINLVIVGAIFLTIIVFVAAMLNAIPPVLAAFTLKFLIYFVLPFFSLILTLLIKESNPFAD